MSTKGKSTGNPYMVGLESMASCSVFSFPVTRFHIFAEFARDILFLLLD